MLGRELRHRSAIVALTACFLFAAFTSSSSAAVLLFGDRTASRNQLSADLAGLGETVTNVASLPVDLGAYDVVWHVGANVALTASERQRLVDFVIGGGGLHLSGEQSCCETLNDSLEAVINSLIIGGGVLVGGQGSPNGPYTFNAAATGAVTRTPNSLLAWSPVVPGAMGGSIANANVLVTAANGKILGAAWDESMMVSGRGRLSILMDADWFVSTNQTTVVDNLQTFLSTPEPASLLLLGAALLVTPRRRRA